MTDLRGRSFFDLVAGLNAGQHLAVDAVVAFVDGELGLVARDRAAAHLTGCPSCAAEVAAQCQARSVVRSAQCPPAPADLLAALRDIPHTIGLPDASAGLAVTLKAPSSRSPTRAGPLGSSQRWGTGPSVLGRWIGR
ncbi:MAG TPA: zf-HC2 domain-containing protein [Pseudonocardiaceae bacterium]|nr:zf-HC2 domain-containing protein [Pseudonocardiaceae bacterium]